MEITSKFIEQQAMALDTPILKDLDGRARLRLAASNVVIGADTWNPLSSGEKQYLMALADLEDMMRELDSVDSKLRARLRSVAELVFN